jgi:hypothetical protein
MKALLLMRLSFESSRDHLTSAPLQTLHTHKVLSILSFSNTQISKEINPSSFLLQMENLDVLLAILHSSNLLMNPSGCPSTLRRSLSGFFLQNIELNRVLFLCLSAHCFKASW